MFSFPAVSNFFGDGEEEKEVCEDDAQPIPASKFIDYCNNTIETQEYGNKLNEALTKTSMDEDIDNALHALKLGPVVFTQEEMARLCNYLFHKENYEHMGKLCEDFDSDDYKRVENQDKTCGADTASLKETRPAVSDTEDAASQASQNETQSACSKEDEENEASDEGLRRSERQRIPVQSTTVVETPLSQKISSKTTSPSPKSSEKKPKIPPDEWLNSIEFSEKEVEHEMQKPQTWTSLEHVSRIASQADSTEADEASLIQLGKIWVSKEIGEGLSLYRTQYVIGNVANVACERWHNGKLTKSKYSDTFCAFCEAIGKRPDTLLSKYIPFYRFLKDYPLMLRAQGVKMTHVVNYQKDAREYLATCDAEEQKRWKMEE